MISMRLVFGQRRRDRLDEFLLPLHVNRGKHLIFVDRLQQFFVFVLALFFRVGERRNESHLAVEFELVCALLGKGNQIVRGRHPAMLRRSF